MNKEDGEECQRCGEIGEDRRTLWMACFYDMAELRIPLTQVAISGIVQEQTGTRRMEMLNTEIPTYSDMDGAVEQQHRFFTLRVCKDCRADWMQSIKQWFGNIQRREATGTGVYLRKNGAVYEASQDEVDAMIEARGK